MKKSYLLLILCLAFSFLSLGQTNLLCRVYFENGKYSIIKSEGIGLFKALQKLDSNAKYGFELRSYADPVGNELANLALANNRGESVKTEITKIFPRASFQLKAIGEVGLNQKDSFVFYRRVDVYYTKLRRDLAKDDIHIGESIVLDGILFEGSSSELMPSSYPSLDTLLKVLTQRREYSVALYGHINPYNPQGILEKDAAKEVYDKKTGLNNLSFARAEAVKAYLVNHGIDKNRIACFGMMGKYPISKTESHLNRRVEVSLKSVKIRDKAKAWEQLLERSQKEKRLIERKFNFEAIDALDSIYFRDQGLRNELELVYAKFGMQSEAAVQLWKQIDASDSLNQLVLKHLVAKYGWLGKSSIGYRGETTIFLVIQHAPLAYQKEMFPLMKVAVSKGEANAVNLAYLEDRILVIEGKKQKYGTQVMYNAKLKRYELAPILDVSSVNVRRQKLGLGTVEQYLKQFNP